jgi:hypothetical protein
MARAARARPLPVIASEAKQSRSRKQQLDCFAAALLAMTVDAAPNRLMMCQKSREAVLLNALKKQVNADAALTRRGRFLSATFLIEIGSEQWLVDIVEGKITSVALGPFVMPAWSFALRAPQEEWQKFWNANPRPGSNDLMALIKRRVLKVEGDVGVFMANLRYFKECLQKLRAERAAP